MLKSNSGKRPSWIWQIWWPQYAPASAPSKNKFSMFCPTSVPNFMLVDKSAQYPLKYSIRAWTNTHEGPSYTLEVHILYPGGAILYTGSTIPHPGGAILYPGSTILYPGGPSCTLDVPSCILKLRTITWLHHIRVFNCY